MVHDVIVEDLTGTKFTVESAFTFWVVDSTLCRLLVLGMINESNGCILRFAGLSILKVTYPYSKLGDEGDLD